LKLRKKHRIPGAVSEQLIALRDRFVHIAGSPIRAEAETDRDENRIDHLWITISAGEFGQLQITVNTRSLRNRDADLDSRVRMGIIASGQQSVPAPGVFMSGPLDYSTIEAETSVVFDAYERTALESILLEKTRRANFIEAWGEFYTRGHIGIHQVHSRRASSVFLTDHIGRDGAIRFYFGNGRAEMVLFKFFGQL